MNKVLIASVAAICSLVAYPAMAANHTVSHAKAEEIGNASTPQQVELSGDAEAKSLMRLKHSRTVRYYDLKAMDTDNEGKVSRDEFMSYMAEKFNAMPKTADGQVSIRDSATHKPL
jgi:hypothetical protein